MDACERGLQHLLGLGRAVGDDDKRELPGDIRGNQVPRQFHRHRAIAEGHRDGHVAKLRAQVHALGESVSGHGRLEDGLVSVW